MQCHSLTFDPGFCSIFSGAGKLWFVHKLKQLTSDVKSDVKTLNFRSAVTFLPPRKTPNDAR